MLERFYFTLFSCLIMRFLFCNSMRSEHLRTQLQGAPVSWLLNFIFLLTTCTCPKLRRSFAEYGLFCSSSSLIESPFIVKYHHSNINIFTIKKNTNTHTWNYTLLLYCKTTTQNAKHMTLWLLYRLANVASENFSGRSTFFPCCMWTNRVLPLCTDF